MPRKPSENKEENVNIVDEIRKTEGTITDQLMRQNIRHSKEYQKGVSEIRKIKLAGKIKEIERTVYPNGVVKNRLIRTYKT